MPPTPQTLADQVAAEEAAVRAGQPACAFTCPCHGGYTCVRVVHPSGGDNPADGSDKTPGVRAPHVGRDTSGNLVQWTGPHLSAAQLADQAAAAKAAQTATTQAIFAGYDPAAVKAYLTQIGVAVGPAPGGVKPTTAGGT